MSHFYGTIQGNRGEATRAGAKSSGLDATAASYRGAIRTRLFYDHVIGVDMAEVTQGQWLSTGASPSVCLYYGPVHPDDQIIIDEHRARAARDAEDDENPLTAADPPGLKPRGPVEPEPCNCGRGASPDHTHGVDCPQCTGPIEVCEDCRMVMPTPAAGVVYRRPILCSSCDDARAAAALVGCG